MTSKLTTLFIFALVAGSGCGSYQPDPAGSLRAQIYAPVESPWGTAKDLSVNVPSFTCSVSDPAIALSTRVENCPINWMDILQNGMIEPSATGSPVTVFSWAETLPYGKDEELISLTARQYCTAGWFEGNPDNQEPISIDFNLVFSIDGLAHVGPGLVDNTYAARLAILPNGDILRASSVITDLIAHDTQEKAWELRQLIANPRILLFGADAVLEATCIEQWCQATPHLFIVVPSGGQPVVHAMNGRLLGAPRPGRLAFYVQPEGQPDEVLIMDLDFSNPVHIPVAAVAPGVAAVVSRTAGVSEAGELIFTLSGGDKLFKVALDPVSESASVEELGSYGYITELWTTPDGASVIYALKDDECEYQIRDAYPGAASTIIAGCSQPEPTFLGDLFITWHDHNTEGLNIGGVNAYHFDGTLAWRVPTVSYYRILMGLVGDSASSLAAAGDAVIVTSNFALLSNSPNFTVIGHDGEVRFSQLLPSDIVLPVAGDSQGNLYVARMGEVMRMATKDAGFHALPTKCSVTVCDGVATDLASDNQNCGACGNKCSESLSYPTTCSFGGCRFL